MIRRLLIANRAEIAIRIAATARAMGIQTVAVYSDADAGGAHVAACDSAVHIGGSAPADSYLRSDRIIQAALDTGADAIHPGYGFLSENPAFAQSVQDAGLIFVGPSADAMRAMGLKDAAKALMEQAGVPIVPGYHGADQQDRVLQSAAASIGYPVLIKAVAGGGGKGMRRVAAPADFLDALRAARAEAATAFGNTDVLIEKYVDHPRHIEVQIFGDGTRAVHLYERDCSLQRRHQKVIEEAPAPGMTDDMRAAMGAAAVRAAEAIGYCGAGTVEFIVDASDGLRPDRFYFMEMNTRLQVEHPVTEAILGIDLVAWQLDVAAGAPLPAAQEDLQATGHAFEARLYAEDPSVGFLPMTGQITHLAFDPAARVESGVRTGDVISAYYDPMIAKVIVHGADRASALAALDRALAATHVAGLTTNLAFLRALVAHTGFAVGQVDTGLIERDLDALTSVPAPCTRTRAIAVVASLEMAGDGFALGQPLVWRANLTWGGEDIAAHVARDGAGWKVTGPGWTHNVTQQTATWWVDGTKTAAKVHLSPKQACVFWGNTYSFARPDPLDRTSPQLTSDAVTAPMPGIMRSLHVTPGAQVAEGDPLALLEAMKMEHILTAPRDATIAEVAAQAGDQVTAGQLLILLQAQEEQADD